MAFVRGQRPRHEVEEWIAWNVGIRRLDLYLHSSSPVNPVHLSNIEAGLARLAQAEPLCYLTKEAPFFGCMFHVTPDVLIPRPETETLVEAAASFLSEQQPGHLFDICTGSGCIGLTLKKLFPDWHVILSDISAAALEVAKKNAKDLALDVEFIQGHLLEALPGKAVCIVANPPYLSDADMQVLDKSVLDYEPKLALHGGHQGTEMISQIFTSLPSHLSSLGRCFVEIGAAQADAVIDLAKQTDLSPILLRDIEHRPRVISCGFCNSW